MTVNIHEAKTQLSRLVEEAAGGREIVIARAGRPVARLVPWPRRSGASSWACCGGRFGSVRISTRRCPMTCWTRSKARQR